MFKKYLLRYPVNSNLSFFYLLQQGSDTKLVASRGNYTISIQVAPARERQSAVSKKIWQSLFQSTLPQGSDCKIAQISLQFPLFLMQLYYFHSLYSRLFVLFPNKVQKCICFLSANPQEKYVHFIFAPSPHCLSFSIIVGNERGFTTAGHADAFFLSLIKKQENHFPAI